MQRITILGSPGAGKSTLARAVAAALDLPLVHLDALYWGPGWVERDGAEFRARLSEIVAGDRWVIDGNYTHCLDVRLPRADTIIVIDRARLVCLWRVMLRAMTYAGRTRPDMGSGCPEKVDAEFIRYIWNYPRRNRPRCEASISEFGSHARLIRLDNDADVRAFLAGLSAVR